MGKESKTVEIKQNFWNTLDTFSGILTIVIFILWVVAAFQINRDLIPKDALLLIIIANGVKCVCLAFLKKQTLCWLTMGIFFISAAILFSY